MHLFSSCFHFRALLYKSDEFVEAAKGTNLFFAVYEYSQIDKETGKVSRKRSFASVPLNQVIDRLKRGLSPAPEDDKGNAPAFVLSPNDLVYLPTEEEREKGVIESVLDKSRIYKMVSCTGNRSFYIPFTVANVISDKLEFSSMNKVEKAISGEIIKDSCIPIKIDRLGNIRCINNL